MKQSVIKLNNLFLSSNVFNKEGFLSKEKRVSSDFYFTSFHKIVLYLGINAPINSLYIILSTHNSSFYLQVLHLYYIY